MNQASLERLHMFRDHMKAANVDLYIVPTADAHQSEYVGEHDQCRAYLTGFTGSAGCAVVTMDFAGLWTDGRYFIQAATQLQGTGFTLMKMGEPEVPSVIGFVETYLEQHSGASIGFCKTTMSAASARHYRKLATRYGATVVTDKELDLVGEIWEDRPAPNANDPFLLDISYTGISAAEKLSMLRERMRELGADVHLIGALDDVNYMLNIRGRDAGDFMVCTGFLLVSESEATLYVRNSNGIMDAMDEAGVSVKAYDEVYKDVANIRNKTILLDCASINAKLYDAIDLCTDGREGSVRLIDRPNPSQLMKAIKNETELDNIRRCHIKDGVAMTEFLYWIKHEVGITPMTEWSAAQYLEECRKRQEGFLGVSFETISAYNANAAMMHYSADEVNCSVLEPEGLLLVDSGGHYKEGTTDITRTIVLGPVPEEWKKHYTLVCKGMLRLAAAHFLYGCTGLNLDILARGPLWDEGIDYKCGTGHGVGYCLSVHEGPNGFRYKHVPERQDQAVLEEGMVTTDEPGVYIEGSHGIRIENELICRKGVHNSDGQFMEFEMLTWTPIDVEAIDLQYFDRKDVELLDHYHEEVYRRLAPMITEHKICEWLYEVTRPVEEQLHAMRRGR